MLEAIERRLIALENIACGAAYPFSFHRVALN